MDHLKEEVLELQRQAEEAAKWADSEVQRLNGEIAQFQGQIELLRKKQKSLQKDISMAEQIIVTAQLPASQLSFPPSSSPKSSSLNTSTSAGGSSSASHRLPLGSPPASSSLSSSSLKRRSESSSHDGGGGASDRPASRSSSMDANVRSDAASSQGKSSKPHSGSGSTSHSASAQGAALTPPQERALERFNLELNLFRELDDTPREPPTEDELHYIVALDARLFDRCTAQGSEFALTEEFDDAVVLKPHSAKAFRQDFCRRWKREVDEEVRMSKELIERTCVIEGPRAEGRKPMCLVCVPFYCGALSGCV